MAFTKTQSRNMTVFSIAGLCLGGAVARSSGIAYASLTTKVFSGIGSSGPVTVVWTIKPESSSDSCINGPYEPSMGFIGHECQATDQRGTLPYVTSTVAKVGSSSSASNDSITVYTTFLSSYTTTTTLAPSTVTRTISEVVSVTPAIPSMTVTAMCDWPEENIITPCTTVVLATSGATPIPTTSKSAAIPSANNPLKSITMFVKRVAENTITFLTGLTGIMFTGGDHGTDEVHGENLHAIQRRQVKDCSLPALYTPVIMTIISILNAIGLFYFFDPVRHPRKVGYYTALYVVVFIIAYIVMIDLEYYTLSIAPAWKHCIWTTEEYKTVLANLNIQATACKPSIF